jgi:hypothetical protein
MIDELLKGGWKSFDTRVRMARLLGLIPHCTHLALCKLGKLRNHFAHHHGTVSLTMDRVKPIVNDLTQNTTRPVKIAAAFIEGDISARSPALQAFLGAVASLRITLGDKTQVCITGPKAEQLRKQYKKR